MTRRLLALFAIALLSAGITACGGASKGAGSASQGSSNASATASAPGTAASSAAPTQGANGNDRDNDGDKNDDDEKVLDYGHAANAADNQAITALVRRYYAAAAAEDGAKACSLLYPFIAEAIVENYANTALQGKTCAAVMAKLFKEHHQLLTGESVTLKFVRVRVEGGKALAVISFPVPEVRQISARLYGGRWKILDLLDGILE
jgi:hypothetical protein